MGADAFANEDGVFEIEIRPWTRKDGTQNSTRKIRIEGLDPEQKIDIEIMEGRDR